MKKILILSTALLAGASAAMADDFVAGNVSLIRDGYTLTNEWGCAQFMDRTELDFRTGIGTGDKFFVIDHYNGVVKVFYDGEKKADVLIWQLSGFDAKHSIWVSCNADDAGNVIVRTDNYDNGPGWEKELVTANYTTAHSSFVVLDPDDYSLLKKDVRMPDGINNSRFDALCHVRGNILEDEGVSFFCPLSSGSTKMAEFVYDKCEPVETNFIPVSIDSIFAGTASASITTLGFAQQFSDTEMAVLANPNVSVTGSTTGGYGNAIRIYEKTVSRSSDEWTATDKYIITPEHSPISGFHVFTLNGRKFIVYPAGKTTACDGFAVTEVKYTDTPKTGDSAEELTNMIARKDFVPTSTGAVRYPVSSYNSCFNVEPDEEDPNSVHIYQYTAPCYMAKWKFSTTVMPTGVEAVDVESEDAPVEFYNLQGVRVENPENGIFIRRQGSKTTKVFL